MKLVCPNCYNVFDQDLVSGISCPLVGCQSNLIKIEDLIIAPIIRLLKQLVWIKNACPGHIYLDHFYPNITFVEHLDGKEDLEKIRSICEKVNTGSFFITEIQEDEEIEMYAFHIGFETDFPIDLTDEEKLKIQYEFVNFLYLIAEEIERWNQIERVEDHKEEYQRQRKAYCSFCRPKVRTLEKGGFKLVTSDECENPECPTNAKPEYKFHDRYKWDIDTIK